ncbi:MAG: hypothetical protein WDN00_08245 [Limisphaerales bacterium]
MPEAELPGDMPLLMEATMKVWGHYKLANFDGEHLLKSHVGKWQQNGSQFAERLRKTLRLVLDGKLDPESAIAELLPN